MKQNLLRRRPSSKDLVCSIPMSGGFMTGAILRDEAGSYDGTATNTPTISAPGYRFVAASGQYIDIGAGPNPVKTISLWINQDDVAGNEYPIDLNGTDYIAVESGVVTVYGLAGHILYVDGVAGTSGVTTITAIWHHIALTDSTANNASDLDIGRKDVFHFEGVISDVLLYSSVLTAEAIRSIFEVQKHKYQYLS